MRSSSGDTAFSVTEVFFLDDAVRRAEFDATSTGGLDGQ
jgi:hypothetical protein